MLTDEPPKLRRVRTFFKPPPAYSSNGQRIEMLIDPSTPPKEVVDAYSTARESVVGGEFKTQEPKALRLARFTDQRPPGENWKDSLARWNKAYPDDDFGDDVKRFQYLATRARRTFLEQRERISRGGVPLVKVRGPWRLRSR